MEHSAAGIFQTAGADALAVACVVALAAGGLDVVGAEKHESSGNHPVMAALSLSTSSFKRDHAARFDGGHGFSHC